MSRPILIAVTALLLAGCGDPAPAEDPRDAQIAQLTRALEDLTASNASLSTEVRRQGRQLAGLSRDRVARSHTAAGAQPVHAASDNESEAVIAADGTATGSGSDNASADEGAEDVMNALLETETGRKAIEKATAREIERREAKDRRLFVSYQVGRFARRAGLDDDQTRKLQGIWKTSMDGGVELRKQFAAIGKLPEAARENARAEAMQSMRELGQVRLESVSEILNDEQLGLYEKTEEEIVSGLHGGSRR